VQAALLARDGAIGLVFPRAVEVQPVGVTAVKLGAGKFGAGDGMIGHVGYLALLNLSIIKKI
jgi:hypothetical protein